MKIQGSDAGRERLFSIGEQTARLYKRKGAMNARPILSELSEAIKKLNETYELLCRRYGSCAGIPSACEWVLDNRYIAIREAAAVREALKKDMRLRRCDDGALILCLGKSYLKSLDYSFAEDSAIIFTEGFQSLCVLSRQELLLFPAMLRAALIIKLSELCEELSGTDKPEEVTSAFASVFSSLRRLHETDEGRLIDALDVCEKTLREDPAGVYPEMDDLSRAYYRERLSYLAKKSSMEEHKLARHLLSKASRSKGDARHIGYWLYEQGSDNCGESAGKAARYIAVNILFTLFLSILCGFLSKSFFAALLLILPLSELTKALFDHILLICIKPVRLPRLELKSGVPEEAKTVCVISALLSGTTESRRLCKRLEELYLTNRDCGQNLVFGILADLPEAENAVSEKDGALLCDMKQQVGVLNAKYGGGFYLFTRRRSFDEGRGKFSGFERKRGAILALSALLCGEKTELIISEGNAGFIKGARYILTLDSDTVPSPDSIRELVGAMEHPLNRAVIDRERGCVISGFGLMHPKMSCDLRSVCKNDFTRVFAGSGGIEPYSLLSGEVYMDLFSRGGFSGKGIINAEALLICSKKHIPDGAILSHDALEGAYLKGGYMSDTEFSDSFPSSLIAYYRRLHRWTRGDWQNAGFVFKKSSGLCDIERFRLFDSLRRSLVAPMSLLTIFLGLTLNIKWAFSAALIALIALAVRIFIELSELGTRRSADLRSRFRSDVKKGLSEALIAALARLLFLPYEAYISISAAVTALWRMLISRRNLLQWETASQTELKKQSLPGFYLNMRFSLLSGLLLIIFGYSVFAKSAGVLWAVSPVIALAMSSPYISGNELGTEDKDYLLSHAGSIWGYFLSFCTEEDNYLPPDNYQENPPAGLAHRTSPTNIGLALVSALCALELGLDRDGKAVFIIEKMLDTLEKMPRLRGHFYNWYDTRSLRALEPRYISTVDSGNLFACLIALKHGLLKYREAELSERVRRLCDDMSFTWLFDKSKKLFHLGFDVRNDRLSESHYDLLSSEARLTSYLAIAKGDVRMSHWRRLSRAMRSFGGFKGMASWTGTMFEYLMPELFLPLCKNSLQYETLKYCLFVQKSRKSPCGVWGISESAFFSLDSELNFRYKAHGCEALALKRGQELELVISPYSSFLALLIEPKAAIKNLRRLEKQGAVGFFGFIEAIDFSPSRCRSEKGEQVRSFMSHHLGMSLISITNCLRDGVIKALFMSEPCMSAYGMLLCERLPLYSDVLKLDSPGEQKPGRSCKRQWGRHGVCVDYVNPECAVLSNGRYSIMLTESGISRSCLEDILIAKTPGERLYHGHGIELYLELCDKRLSFLPESAQDAEYSWELGELSCSYKAVLEEAELKTSCSCAGADNGELRFAYIKARRDLSARLCLELEPVLAAEKDYVNHPAYWRLGLEAKTGAGCLMLHRLKRGSSRELWMCITCDKGAEYLSDRHGDMSFLSAPFVRAFLDIKLKVGEEFSARFAVCTAESAEEAYRGANHMLAIGPSEYGLMPTAAASLMKMTASEVGAAMSFISPLWFSRANELMPPKDALWKNGISGDYPLIVCPEAGASRDACVELIKEFCLLKSCGINAELVFLSDDNGEYYRPVYSAVRDTLALYGLEALLGTDGGVRIVPTAESENILSSASVIIGEEKTSERRAQSFPAVLKTERALHPGVGYSHGEDRSFRFYVNRELPARAWTHILTNGSFSYLASDSGCGNMWYENARELRINSWENDPRAIRGPEGLEYISQKGRFSLFADNDGIPCRISFGFGFAIWEKSFGETGIRTTAFIPKDINARVLIIEVCGKETGQLAWHTSLQLGASALDGRSLEIDYVNSIFKARNPRGGFPDKGFTAMFSSPVLSWTSELFSWYQGNFDGKTKALDSPAFAAVLNLQNINIIVCGCDEEDKLLSLCKPKSALSELKAVKELWISRVRRLKLHSSAAFSGYMSGWAAYQTIACRILARCSLYQSGGAIGFRDQLQDAVNMLLISPELARAQILVSCRHQYTEGDVMHWWHPLPDGDKGVRTRCSDDMLWLVWALCEYAEKTGDTSICSEEIYYVNSASLADTESDRYECPTQSELSETVLSHAERAIDCCFGRGVGSHGLLFFGSGDWNDGMDNIRGESVWLSQFFAHTVKRFADLLIMLCRREQNDYRLKAERIGKAADRAFIKTHYLRGYWEDGSPLGNSDSDCCRLDSVTQSWAAFSPFSSDDKVDLALDTAVSLLYDRENKIIKLFDPPFYGSRRYPGYIQGYGAGFRENGGQYTHAAIWLSVALIKRGRINDGYSILSDLIPETHDIKTYEAEPFVLPADIYSAPGHVGEAGWTWYTGSAGWYFRAVSEELLGLRLISGTLFIRPSLPDSLPETRVILKKADGNELCILYSDNGVSVNGAEYDGKGIVFL